MPLPWRSSDQPTALQERGLIRDLKVRQAGRLDGRQNHPATHESRPSATEQAIFTAFENAASQLRQHWVNSWRKANSTIDAHQFNAWEEDYESPTTQAKTKMEEHRQQLRDRMIAARVAERAARNQPVSRTALIVRISGHDGAYLARSLLDKGYDVYGTSRNIGLARTDGLRALGIRDKVSLLSVSPVDFRSVSDAIERVAPHEIYNLSGQSSVALSFSQPAETLSSVTQATI